MGVGASYGLCVRSVYHDQGTLLQLEEPRPEATSEVIVVGGQVAVSSRKWTTPDYLIVIVSNVSSKT